MARKIILSGQLDGKPVNARVMDRDFIPQIDDVLDVKLIPSTGSIFAVVVKDIKRNDFYILESC